MANSTIYLKANSEEEFTSALKSAGWVWDTEYEFNENGDPVLVEEEHSVLIQGDSELQTHTRTLDIIGTIHLLNEEDPAQASVETVDGWHANLLLHGEELPDALSEFVMDAPSNPVRRFA